MLTTLEERKKFINSMMTFLSNKYNLSDTQIFVFGSFLTNEYEPGKSDIDIGIYCENETKMYDIECDLDIYFDKYKLKHDIVIMHLNKNLWINIPILTYGKPLTTYEDEKLFNYLVDMIKRWGFSPQERIKEVV